MATRNPRRWWILIVLCLSTLVLVIDSMALTVAVPSMAEDIGASTQDIQWILDSYILVFAGLLLTSGSLGDRFGRRKFMIIGLLLFGAASLAATFCTNPGEVITARVAMGVGGALIMPSTLSILTRSSHWPSWRPSSSCRSRRGRGRSPTRSARCCPRPA